MTIPTLGEHAKVLSLLGEWFQWWQDDGEAPVKMPKDDKRFTFGLTMDVRDVLIKQGYKVEQKHFVEVQQALFRLLYLDTDIGLDAGQKGGADDGR